MKHIISFLLAVLFAVSFVSCSSTRKVASEQTQQHINTTVTSDVLALSNKSEAVEYRKTETDLSNIVIDFTKIEYADGTQTVTTNGEAQCDTVRQFDREATEPPNATQAVKSITSGRVTFNNDKTTQTTSTVTSEEVTQVEKTENTEVTQDATSETKTEDKEKHGFFFYVGVTTCGILLFVLFLVVSYFLIRQKLKKN